MTATGTKPYYECNFCNKKFSSLVKLHTHECEAKRRHEFSKTKQGLIAYETYCYWQKCRGYRVTNVQTFLDSKYYNCICQFIKYSKVIGLPDKNLYIDFMISCKLLPNFWRNEELTTFYMQKFDEITPPRKLIKISLSTLSTLTELLDCPVDKVFTKLEPIELIQLINERKITPWLLLLSKSFLIYMRDIANSQDRILLNSIVDADVWRLRFKKNPEIVQYVKQIVNTIGL